MRYSLTSMVRLLVILLVGSSAAAVGVSRIVPPPATWRMPTPADHVMINAFFIDQSLRGTFAVERDGAGMRSLDLVPGDCLDHASCSPWRNDKGEAQVVGRWSREPGEGDADLFGLARVSFPGGQAIDRVATEIVPVSAPAWYPGTRARVLFTAGDGALYDYAFERPGGDPAVVGHDESPNRIDWACRRPGLGEVYMSDPHWPADPGFAHVVFVTLRKIEPDRQSRSYSTSKVWWLRIGDDGRTIEAAGPFREPAEADAGVEERCPVVNRRPDGGLVLSYLRKGKGPTWSLWTVPVGFRATDRRIPVAGGRGRELAEGCLPSAPIFSIDGRWISAVVVDDDGRKVVRRFEADGRPGTDVSSDVVPRR